MIQIDYSDGEGYLDDDAILTTKYDIWSVGVILYTLMYGEKPFETKYLDEDEATADLFAKIKNGNFTIPNWNTKLPLLYADYHSCDKLVDMLCKMLEYDPNKRWSAAELLKHSIFDPSTNLNVIKEYDDVIDETTAPTEAKQPDESKQPNQSVTNATIDQEENDGDEKHEVNQQLLSNSTRYSSPSDTGNSNLTESSAAQSYKQSLTLRETMALHAQQYIDLKFNSKFGTKHGHGYNYSNDFSSTNRQHGRGSSFGSFNSLGSSHAMKYTSGKGYHTKISNK